MKLKLSLAIILMNIFMTYTSHALEARNIDYVFRIGKQYNNKYKINKKLLNQELKETEEKYDLVLQAIQKVRKCVVILSQRAGYSLRPTVELIPTTKSARDMREILGRQKSNFEYDREAFSFQHEEKVIFTSDTSTKDCVLFLYSNRGIYLVQ